MEDFISQIKEKKLKVVKKVSFSPVIKIDPKLMRIVVSNLLSNSIKYTPPGGKIILEIKKYNRDLLLSIADTGYGIPKNQQKKVFTKLFRADNIRTKDTTGTGLGLYIVKAVIDAFGGKIWFKSVKNKGTIFYVSIPLGGVKRSR